MRPNLRRAVAAPDGTYEGLLSEAVSRARHARSKGASDQTLTIMRETLNAALRHTSRRLHLAIVVLLAGLAATAGGAAWKIAGLNHEKRAIDQHIHDIEAQLAKTTEAPAQSDQLITQLTDYQKQARAVGA